MFLWDCTRMAICERLCSSMAVPCALVAHWPSRSSGLPDGNPGRHHQATSESTTVGSINHLLLHKSPRYNKPIKTVSALGENTTANTNYGLLWSCWRLFFLTPQDFFLLNKLKVMEGFKCVSGLWGTARLEGRDRASERGRGKAINEHEEASFPNEPGGNAV